MEKLKLEYNSNVLHKICVNNTRKYESVRKPMPSAKSILWNCYWASYQKNVTPSSRFRENMHKKKTRSGIPDIGKNTMSTTMKTLSQKAGLLHMYTNHSVRATFITSMAKNNVPDRIIAQATQHKSIQILEAYHQPTEEKTKIGSITDGDTDSASNTGGEGDIDSVVTSLSHTEMRRLEQGTVNSKVVLKDNFRGATIQFKIRKWIESCRCLLEAAGM